MSMSVTSEKLQRVGGGICHEGGHVIADWSVHSESEPVPGAH